MKKTVEQKLFESFVSGRGCRLTAEDVDSLVIPDDAVRCRIGNVAACEAGVDEFEAGFGTIQLSDTWEGLKEEIKRIEQPSGE